MIALAMGFTILPMNGVAIAAKRTAPLSMAIIPTILLTNAGFRGYSLSL